jgi:hypothetical protein
MDRTTAPYYATIAGKRAFQNANPGAGIAIGTGLVAADQQAWQEEIMSVIEGAGLVGDPANLAQLLQAIRTLGRIKLTANTTFYVNAITGNDITGTGTVGAPWATRQKAVNVLANSYDLGGFNVTISCLGNFTAGVFQGAPLVGQTSASALIFDGGGTAQVSVVSSQCFNAGNAGQFTVQNFGLLSTSGSTAGDVGDALAVNQGTILHGGNTFGSCVGSHIALNGSGGFIDAIASYSISGGAGVSHIFAQANATAFIGSGGGITIALSGSPAFTGGFVTASIGGAVIYAGATFSGGATGPRYSVSSGGIIQTSGGGANFFPGNAVGTNDGTGIYQ